MPRVVEGVEGLITRSRRVKGLFKKNRSVNRGEGWRGREVVADYHLSVAVH